MAKEGEDAMLDCITMEKNLKMWCTVLRSCNVYDVPKSVGRPWFQRCNFCRKGKRDRHKCSGATVNIDRGYRIKFPPTDEGLVPELAVRTIRGGAKAMEDAVLEHSVEIYVRDAKDGSLAHFSRVERGKGTAEPRYHLQFGGSAADGSFPSKSDCLRWPVPLYDFILVSELVLYTFYREEWENHILRKSEGLHLVRQSERFYLGLWMERWKHYSTSDPPRHTFLSFSCTSYQDK